MPPPRGWEMLFQTQFLLQLVVGTFFKEAKCRDSIHKMCLWRRQFGLLLLGKSNQTALRLLRWSGDQESTCQCRARGFRSWSGGLLMPPSAVRPCPQVLKPVSPEPVFQGKRGPPQGKPAHRTQGTPTCRTKTQDNQESKKGKEKPLSLLSKTNLNKFFSSDSYMTGVLISEGLFYY